MATANHYYIVKFKFAGKKSALAYCGDFVIQGAHTWHDAQKQAQCVAAQKLQQMFKDIFPDAALPHLANPETVIAIKGQVFITEDVA